MSTNQPSLEDNKDFQVYFVKTLEIFVLPLWKEISLLWPSFKIFSDQVESNIEELQKVLDGLATNP